jgi:hypothetical protein
MTIERLCCVPTPTRTEHEALDIFRPRSGWQRSSIVAGGRW